MCRHFASQNLLGVVILFSASYAHAQRPAAAEPLLGADEAALIQRLGKPVAVPADPSRGKARKPVAPAVQLVAHVWRRNLTNPDATELPMFNPAKKLDAIVIFGIDAAGKARTAELHFPTQSQGIPLNLVQPFLNDFASDLEHAPAAKVFPQISLKYWWIKEYGDWINQGSAGGMTWWKGTQYYLPVGETSGQSVGTFVSAKRKLYAQSEVTLDSFRTHRSQCRRLVVSDARAFWEQTFTMLFDHLDQGPPTLIGRAQAARDGVAKYDYEQVLTYANFDVGAEELVRPRSNSKAEDEFRKRARAPEQKRLPTRRLDYAVMSAIADSEVDFALLEESARRLAQLPNHEIGLELANLLQKKSPLLQDRAGRLLGILRDHRAVPALIQALADNAKLEGVRAGLTALAGKDLGAEAADWRAWWAGKQAELLADCETRRRNRTATEFVLVPYQDAPVKNPPVYHRVGCSVAAGEGWHNVQLAKIRDMKGTPCPRCKPPT